MKNIYNHFTSYSRTRDRDLSFRVDRPCRVRWLRSRWRCTTCCWLDSCSRLCSGRSWSLLSDSPRQLASKLDFWRIDDGCRWWPLRDWGSGVLWCGCLSSALRTCHTKTVLFEGLGSEAGGKGTTSSCIIWSLNGKRVTFALAAVIILRDGLLFEEVLDHAQDIAVIVMAEVEAIVPSVVEGDGLIGAGPTDDLRQHLASKVVADHWVLTLSIVRPPLFTLYWPLFTISCRLFLLRSAFSYLYFGFLERFKSWLSSSSKARRNYWASCWP